MNIDWLQIVTTVLLVVAGFFVSYFKQRSDLIDQAKYAINNAEKRYEEYTKAGAQKFEFVCSLLYDNIPAPMKLFITRETVATIVQSVFDGMKRFAEQQLDRVFKKEE